MHNNSPLAKVSSKPHSSTCTYSPSTTLNSSTDIQWICVRLVTEMCGYWWAKTHFINPGAECEVHTHAPQTKTPLGIALSHINLPFSGTEHAGSRGSVVDLKENQMVSLSQAFLQPGIYIDWYLAQNPSKFLLSKGLSQVLVSTNHASSTSPMPQTSSPSSPPGVNHSTISNSEQVCSTPHNN